MKAFLVSAFVVLSVPALAQAPDVAQLQKAIGILQTQRNNAADAQVSSEIRVATVTEENAKLKAENEEFRKQLEAAKSSHD